MTTHLSLRAVAAVAVVAFLAGCLAAVSQAQTPVPTSPDRTVVAVGDGTASVTPTDRNDNAAIGAAVDAAQAKALPAAIADAKAEAQELATAVGGTLGQLVSITNQTANGYFFYGIDGTFGPGKWCGKVRTSHLVKGKDGTRHRKLGAPHRVCRFPSRVQRTVQLTYALQ